MIDLHPHFLANLSGAVDHIFAAGGGRPGPGDLEGLVERLFGPTVDGAGHGEAAWRMTWGHLLQHFLEEGASMPESAELAMSCCMGAIMDVCDDVRAGRLDQRVNSLEGFEVYLRWSIERMLEADFATEGA